MTPPPDGESGASAAAPGLQTTPTEAAQASAQSNEASAVPTTPEMSPAESEEKEADEMVEALEDLILEAYNNIQIDGEYIFLPDEVAEKLHRVAEQVCGLGGRGEGVTMCCADLVACVALDADAGKCRGGTDGEQHKCWRR